MDSDFNQLLKGRWEYNLINNKLICKNKDGIYYIFENKNNDVFSNITSILSKKGVPNIDLKDDFFEKPTSPLSLEDFHRVLYSCEFVYEQSATLKETNEGLLCYSEHIKNFILNHKKYKSETTVKVEPQKICKITRRIRDRKRIITKISLDTKTVALECEFPWTILTICFPTINLGDDINENENKN